jgi:O-antigen ligase
LMVQWVALRAINNPEYIETVAFDDRQEIWQRPWSVITDSQQNFYLGTGSNTYPLVVQYPPGATQKEKSNMFAHNQWLLFWQEYGLVGLMVFGYLFFVIVSRPLAKSDQVLRNYQIGMTAVVILTLLHGIFDHQFSLVNTRNLFFLALAISEA